MKNKAAMTLGKRGGSKTSEAKTAAARANGLKGGRPKKKLCFCYFGSFNEACQVHSNASSLMADLKRRAQLDDQPALNKNIISSVLD